MYVTSTMNTICNKILITLLIVCISSTAMIYAKTDENVFFGDSASGIKFAIPNGSLIFPSNNLLSFNNDNNALIFGKIDIYDIERNFNPDIVSRNSCDNTKFSTQDLAEYLGTSKESVFKTELNGNEYFVYADSSIIIYILIRNGYFNYFACSPIDLTAIENWLNTVELLPPYIKE